MVGYGKLNFAVAFNPQSAFPLDARTLFYSYDEALSAAQTAKRAGSTDTVYYYGMHITVVDMDKELARQYIIQPGGRLLGTSFVSETSSGGGGGAINPDQLDNTLLIDPITGKLSVNVAHTIDVDDRRPVSSMAVVAYVEDQIEDSLGLVEDQLADI